MPPAAAFAIVTQERTLEFILVSSSFSTFLGVSTTPAAAFVIVTQEGTLENLSSFVQGTQTNRPTAQNFLHLLQRAIGEVLFRVK